MGDDLELRFPATTADATTSPSRLYEALGAVSKYAGKSKYDYLLKLDSEAMVR